MPPTEHPRSIRSFVTRAGRITPAQERALAELWPKYGIDVAPQVLDCAARFGRTAPLTIEIGFGNGANLLALAREHPERDYLGVEVHRPGAGRLLLALEEFSVTNVRVICDDAVQALARQIAPGAAQEILILFPDPWPKKRHHKRRLLQRGFAELAVSRLCIGGVLRVATDWAPYAQQILAVLGAIPGLENLAADAAFVPRPTGRAPTRFEKRGVRLGHDVWDLAFRRIRQPVGLADPKTWQ
ncbi:MAG: tRNA (guanosine(46)-N7)-methyltransferase TrmB [Steroidobacteraceae bacterium]